MLLRLAILKLALASMPWRTYAQPDQPVPAIASTTWYALSTVNVSERDIRNRKRPFVFRSADGTETTVWTPDPGRALITGAIDGDPAANGAPFFTSLNAFKIPSLWGVKNTAPYFHDNSAMTLEDVVDHYGDFVFNKLPRLSPLRSRSKTG